MIKGAPPESRWVRAAPRHDLPARVLNDIVGHVFPQQGIVEIQPMHSLRNSNSMLKSGPASDWFVLRIYEHDPSICRKELDLLAMIQDSIPVPDIIYAEPAGREEIPPFVLYRYVEGVEFRELKRDREAYAQAAYAIGQTLAAIHKITFNSSGWLGPGPSVSHPLIAGENPVPRSAGLCFQSPNLQRYVGAVLREKALDLVWSQASTLAGLEDKSLVHGDFGKRNVIVRQVSGTWAVAAVLDWEFAFSGSPLADAGHLLRYERMSRPTAEPHFSNGYTQAGGKLPDRWRILARTIDLIALCESLTHDDLTPEIAAELAELVSATVEDRDPRLP